MNEKAKDENVAQMPNMPTHTAVTVEVMGELLNTIGNKLTWSEANPLMMKVQGNAIPLTANDDSTGFQILTVPPKA